MFLKWNKIFFLSTEDLYIVRKQHSNSPFLNHRKMSKYLDHWPWLIISMATPQNYKHDQINLQTLISMSNLWHIPKQLKNVCLIVTLLQFIWEVNKLCLKSPFLVRVVYTTKSAKGGRQQKRVWGSSTNSEISHFYFEKIPPPSNLEASRGNQLETKQIL